MSCSPPALIATISPLPLCFSVRRLSRSNPSFKFLQHIDKLNKVVEEGNCYGALQMYKSISARYVTAQRFSEALDILFSGACIELEHGLCYPGEDDLVIARAVLMYLTMGNIKDANFLMDKIKRQAETKIPSFQNQTLSILSYIFWKR